MKRPAALTRTLVASVVAMALLAGCAHQEKPATTALDKLQERASTIRQLASEQNLSTALDEVTLLEIDLDKAAADGHIAADMQQDAANALAEVRRDLEVLAGEAAEPEGPQRPELPVPAETFSQDGEDWSDAENREDREDWEQWENDDGGDGWDDEDRDRWEDQQDEAWDEWEDQRDDSSDDEHR